MDPQHVRLIDTLYDAAIDPAAMDAFLQDLSQVTDSAVGVIYREGEANQKDFLSSYGAPREQLTAYAGSSDFRGEFCSHLSPYPTAGTIAYTQDALPGKRLYSASFYSDFLLPQGLEQSNFLFIEHDTIHSLGASFMRDSGTSGFDARHKTVFRQVMPHLQRTFRLKKLTNDSLLHQCQAWDMLSLIPYGVIVFSNLHKVMYINKAAEQMSQANDGLELNSSRLGARVWAENRQLRQLIRNTIDSTMDPVVSMGGGDMMVTRPSGKRAYSVMVNPISPGGSAYGVYPAAIVILQDHEHGMEAPIARMRALYDLTPTESEVANQMMQGYSLDECARNLGHTVSTSRNLLKRVFAKTGTRRQNELVSLMLRSPLSLLRRPFRRAG